MADEVFDVIVVGAGPAGSAAALTCARAGLSTVLLERGEYPGSKNVQGAVLYTKMLADLVPDFWRGEAPFLERPITEENIWVLTEDSGFRAGFRSEKWLQKPHNAYTIIRTRFDRWFAQEAESAGAQLFCGVTVRDVIKKDGRIVGIRTSEGDELLAQVVIACDGANAMLAQKAGLMDEWKAGEMALAVKEVMSLPQEKIEDRFNLEGGEGVTHELFGDLTRGMLGYGFLYTNKDTLSFGVGCKLSHFQESGIRPYDLLAYAKNHPMIRRMIHGAKPVEYSAHLIPEGGFHSMPPLYADGFMVAGDAAQMVNAAHREGSNLAMLAGQLAAQTVIEAHKKGDVSATALAAYGEKIKASVILPDLKEVRDIEPFVENFMDLFRAGPTLLAQSMFDYFNVDGRTRPAVHSAIIERALHHPAVRRFVRSNLTFKNALLALRYGWAGVKKFREPAKG